MYDVLGLEQAQAAQQRAREPPDEAQAEPLVVVLLYQLVQVYAGMRGGGVIAEVVEKRLQCLSLREPIVGGSFCRKDNKSIHLNLPFLLHCFVRVRMS